MSDIKVMKAVEFDKLPAKLKKQYQDADALRAAGWWMQPKYDGCFAMVVMRRAGASQVLSRTGEDYTASCQHLIAELRDAADARARDGKWEDFVVIGEVWHPELEFPTISGKFRRQAPSPDLVLMVHDILPIGLTTTLAYKHRYDDVHQLLPAPQPGERAACYAVENYWGHSTPNAYANQLKTSGGYDGAVLKSPHAGYTIGTVKLAEIVKVKPNITLDLKVVGVTSTPGEKTGRDVFTLVVDLGAGKTSKVGSGVPHDATAVPQVGDIVEIEVMGYTPDGFLREPRFKAIRHDKETPDA